MNIFKSVFFCFFTFASFFAHSWFELGTSNVGQALNHGTSAFNVNPASAISIERKTIAGASSFFQSSVQENGTLSGSFVPLAATFFKRDESVLGFALSQTSYKFKIDTNTQILNSSGLTECAGENTSIAASMLMSKSLRGTRYGATLSLERRKQQTNCLGSDFTSTGNGSALIAYNNQNISDRGVIRLGTQKDLSKHFSFGATFTSDLPLSRMKTLSDIVVFQKSPEINTKVNSTFSSYERPNYSFTSGVSYKEAAFVAAIDFELGKRFSKFNDVSEEVNEYMFGFAPIFIGTQFDMTAGYNFSSSLNKVQNTTETIQTFSVGSVYKSNSEKTGVSARLSQTTAVTTQISWMLSLWTNYQL